MQPCVQSCVGRTPCTVGTSETVLRVLAGLGVANVDNLEPYSGCMGAVDPESMPPGPAYYNADAVAKKSFHLNAVQRWL